MDELQSPPQNPSVSTDLSSALVEVIGSGLDDYTFAPSWSLVKVPEEYVPTFKLIRVDEHGDAFTVSNGWDFNSIVQNIFVDLEGGIEIINPRFGLSTDVSPTSVLHYPYFPDLDHLVPIVMARYYTPEGYDAFANSLENPITGFTVTECDDAKGNILYFYQNRGGQYQIYTAFFIRFGGNFILLRLISKRAYGMLHLSAQIEATRLDQSTWETWFDAGSALQAREPGYDWIPDTSFASQSGIPKRSFSISPQGSPKREAASASGLTTRELDLKKIAQDKERAKKRKRKEDKTTFRLQSGVRPLPNLCLQGPATAHYRSQFNLGLPTINIGTSPALQSALSDMSERAQNVSDMLPQIASLLSGVRQEGVNHTFSLDSTWLHVPATVLLFFTGYMAVVEGGKWYAIGGALGVTYATTCAFAHKDWLMERLAKIFARDPDQIHSQSFNLSVIEDLAGAITGLMAFNSSKSFSTSSAKFSSFVSSLKTFDRTKSGLSAAMSFAVQTVTRIVNWFRAEFLGLDSISAMSSSIPELDSWVQKVDSIQREAFDGTLSVNSENSARLEALRIEGAHLALKKFAQSEVHQVNAALRIFTDILKKVNIPFERANLTGGGCRMEPVIVLMTGNPGVGKTFAMMPVLLKVLEQVLPKEQRDSLGKNFMDHVYPRCPETKFWDGYRGQFATMYDDFGQARDVAGQPDNEFLEMIRAGNIFPYPLHMADIADKGNTEFVSRIILCTSNLSQFTPNSIVSHEAVMRRFNLIVKVFPKKEFCFDPDVPTEQRRLNPKCKAIDDGFDPRIYEFHVRRSDGTKVGTETSEILDFDGIVERIVEIYRASSSRADSYLSCLNEIAAYKSQSGSSEPSDFLRDFSKRFGEETDLSMLDLDDILKRKKQSEDRMNIHQFNVWMREQLPGANPDFKNYQVDQELYYHAFKVNEKAFRKCVADKPDRLRDLVEALTTNYDQRVVNLITSEERKKFENAKFMLAEYSSKFRAHSESLLNQFSWLDHWKKALAVAGVISVFLSKSGFFQWLRTLFPMAAVALEDSGIQMIPESGGPRMRHPNFKVTQPKGTAFKSEGGVDLGCVQMRDVIIGRNQYLLHYPPSGYKFGYVTFVDGRHLLMPKHFITGFRSLIEEGRLQTDSQIELHNFITDQVIKVRPLDFEHGLVRTNFGDNDMALVHLEQAHSHRKIISFFVQSAQLKNHDVLPVQLCHVFKFEDNFGVNIHNSRAHRKASQFIDNEGQDSFTVRDVLEYQAPTEDGDCGMLVIAHQPGFGPGKVLGFHIAGSNNALGIGAVVTREALEEAFSKIVRTDFAPPEEGKDYKSQFGVTQKFKGFLEVGQTDKAITAPGSTAIRRSKLHNLWSESPKAPACLRPKEVDGVVVDPMYRAIMNYGQSKPAIDKKLFRVATRSVSASMLKLMCEPGAKPRRYSFEEAVLGVPQERYCKSVPRSTSAGFPYVLNPVPTFRGKEWYFGKGVEFDLTRPAAQKLRAECDLMIEKAKRGERSEIIFLDVLKDEPRKKERVRTAETRLVSASPLAYSIVCRMFFLAWAVSMTNNNLRIGVGVGINAYSEDWDFLARRLLSVGENMLAGDFKGFDTSHGVFICMMVLSLINEFYHNEDDFIRTVLFADVTDSTHLCAATVYVWINGGFPSGHPLTALLQSCANQILHRCAWIKCHPRGVEGLSEFDAHVVLITYGDDSVMSVSNYAIRFFNYHTISVAMRELGYTYTDEVKVGAGEGPPFRSLSEIAFLKRSFRYEPRLTRYVAPLAIESILEMLYWTKKGARAELITKANVEIALRELSLHSKQDFQQWAPLVVEGARDHLEYHPAIVDYEVLQDLATSMECVW